MTIILRVGIYLRLSNEDRNKKSILDDSESIKNQRNLLLDYINKHEDLILTDEYCDEDLSGAGTYRPEFERLIEDCKNKKIDIVLCKSQSRFSRDMEIIEKYINNKFIEWNIRFISLSDNADTDNFGNKKSRQINGLVNEWYLEDISNNIRSAFLSKMKQGEFISPFAAFGYEIDQYDNNKLVIDQIASLIVKKIFNLYLKGYGYTKIAKYLNVNNIPSPSLYKYQKGSKLNIVSNKNIYDIKWNINMIKTILTNELYIGNLIQGKRTTISYKNHKIIKKNKTLWIKKENTHKPIIDKDTFNKVQSLIKNKVRTIRKANIIHSFSKIVYCFECKSFMKKKNSNIHEYLVCSNNMCNNESIRYDHLEKIILNKINELIINNYDESIINKLLHQNSECVYNIERLNSQLIKINKYIKHIYEDKINNIIDTDTFKELLKEYSKEKETIVNEIKLLNNTNSKEIINIYEYIPFNKLNRLIINEYIEKIYITKIRNNTRKIIIKWH